MSAALAAIAFVPGLALGSFLNVVAARVPLRRSVVHPGSACMSCATPIAWYDNLPILSYFLLRGRCRSCGAPIPWKYPLVELVTALLVGACVLAFGLIGGGRRGRVLLRHARRRLGDRPRAPDHPEPDRAARCRDRPARPDRARPVARVGARRTRRIAASSSSRRSPTRPEWAWATSSSRCCSAPCSDAPCRWR